MDAERSGAGATDPGALHALVDGHVHFHERFDEVRFFRAASDNFAAAARVLRVPSPWQGFLVLTESAGTDRFATLREQLDRAPSHGWSVEGTGEEASLLVQGPGGGPGLVIVAGRQIQTSEGLEVLAFPLRDTISDGMPIRTVLDAVSRVGAVSQVPWGFGKWWLRRGRVVRSLLTRKGRTPCLLADTGHRPAWAPRPGGLLEAERRGLPTLTGSDPLPLPGESARPGSCCFVLELPPSGDPPAARLVRAITTLEASPVRHEQRPGAAGFAAKQVSMQIRKRRRQ